MSKQGSLHPATDQRMLGINKKRKGEFEVWKRYTEDYKIKYTNPYHKRDWGNWRIHRCYAKEDVAKQAMAKFQREWDFMYEYELRINDKA